MNEKEKIEKIRERIVKTSSLTISRVPKNTLEAFYKLANDDNFSKDYGMALKFLLDFYNGIIPKGNEHLEAILEDHDDRLIKIESYINELQRKPKSEEKVKKKRLGIR